MTYGVGGGEALDELCELPCDGIIGRVHQAREDVFQRRPQRLRVLRLGRCGFHTAITWPFPLEPNIDVMRQKMHA
jgi:hypothetical protein